MVACAVRFPSSDNTVMYVVPFPTAVTKPFESTFATDGLTDAHVSFLLDAVEGVYEIVNCTVFEVPITKLDLIVFNLIELNAVVIWIGINAESLPSPVTTLT